MSISMVGQEAQTPPIIHLKTGEVVDVAVLDDLAIGLLFTEVTSKRPVTLYCIRSAAAGKQEG